MEIYCRNCKYYKAHTWGPGVKDKTYCDECHAPGNYRVITNHIGKNLLYGPTLNPRQLNANNDCSMYKKKWWKIIKEKT